MTTIQKIGAIVVGILLLLGAGLGTLAYLRPSAIQSFGDVVPNPQWFSSGYGFGNNASLYLSNKLTLGVGVNQAAFQNLTGKTITVDTGRFDLTGTASSTVAVYVGTSTTATVTNQFSLVTVPFWAQLISAGAIATSTNGTYTSQLDNFVNHKSGYPAEIQVLNGQYLLVAVQSFCTADGACNTATSSNRGWTASVPFTYHYDGFN